MRLLLAIIFTGFAWSAFAQTFPLSGDVFSGDGSPVAFSSVVLLNPKDSTMQYFGISNKEGHFEIKNIKKEEYLLQISYLGCETLYKKINVPFEGNDLGSIILKNMTLNLNEVKISGEYVPITIKKDTVEFNAAAFKLKPDAVAEDLLKKLPGVEVDRSGNIKAMGEDVKKLYVDGKEFFGNDPKVATKNLPAKAVDKVQVYDRKSEESMFTGIDDGSRQKSINLKLKEDHKNGVFGDLMTGGGTGEHWQGNAKAYRFSGKTQMAVLGMANNVNQYGFSFNDYMNFNGGTAAMIHGGGSAQIRITSDGAFPINFGQPISGLNTSGAGGANFSYSTGPNDRIFLSYLGNSSKKELEQNTKSWNYTSDNSFIQDESLTQDTRNNAHNFNFGWRTRIDSTQNIILDGNFSVSRGNDERFSKVFSSEYLKLVNKLDNQNTNSSDLISGNANGSYLKKMNYGKSVFKITANASVSGGLSKNLINTLTGLYKGGSLEETVNNIYQDNETRSGNWSLGSSLIQKVVKRLYVEPEINFGSNTESLNRTQGNPFLNTVADSLSPEFRKKYVWFRPKLSLIRNSAKTKITMALELESGKLENTLNEKDFTNPIYTNLLPSLMWEYEFQTGRRMMALYSSSVNTPSVTQLLPVANTLNPLALYFGNPNLKPEQQHNLNFHYLLFDQFSFTSFMATVNGTLTKNKINWDRTINDNLSFVNTLTNVKNDYNLRGNVDFSTPIRKLGMKIHLNVEEGWNQGLNLINAEENQYTNYSHRFSMTVDNRKKEKWDVNTGIEFTLTNSRYSIQKTLNNNYLDMSWFAEMRFAPNNSWNFEANSDIANYTDKSFGKSHTIPLMNFEISRFLLKDKRGTLTLRGFDLLNRNSIVQRLSELNYLREIRSNSIGRFVMLSFTYRLNKFAGNQNSIDVKFRR
jgi:hypothetical protein